MEFLLTPEEQYWWRMYKSWKQGIPCHIYRKERSSDTDFMIRIDKVIGKLNERKVSIENMMRAVK